MAERALDDLLAIMRDPRVGMRQRLNAAVSASRVERLTLPGEAPPEAIVFLRHVIDYKQEGTQFAVEWRREAAAATSFWERRVAKMALAYEVPDQTERRESWRRILNGCIRAVLGNRRLWPERKDVLLSAGEEFAMPALDPELALSALLMPAAANRHARRRARAIDERFSGAAFTGTEAERLAIIKPLADIVEARLKAFGLGESMGHPQPHHPTAAETLAP